MPLIHCPDCNKEISDAAISCPHCGLPRPFYELQNRARKQQEADALADEETKLLWIFGFSAALALLGALLAVMVFNLDWSFATLGKTAMWILLAVACEFGAYWLFGQGREIKRGMKTRFKE